MKIESMSFVIADEHPIEDVDPGIKRQMLGFNDDIMMARVWFENGAIGYEHEHFHSQVSYVESGEFEVNVNGEKRLLRAGDSFYVAPNTLHGAVCKKAGVLLDVFSPAREDFLED